MEIGFKFIDDIFSELWELEEISVLTGGIKIILIGAIVIRFTYMLVINASSSIEKNKFPITKKSIIHTLVVVIGVFNYDWVLNGIDSILSLFFVNFPIWENQAIVQFAPEFGGTEEIQDLDTWAAMKMMAARIVEIVSNPLFLVSKVLTFILWLVEFAFVGLFIGERAFMLLILKMIAPLVWSMSLFPRLSGFLINWFKLYMMWFLLILPYMIVNLIVNAINLALGSGMAEFGLGQAAIEATHFILLPVTILILVMKFKFYSAGKTLFRELITVESLSDIETKSEE